MVAEAERTQAKWMGRAAIRLASQASAMEVEQVEQVVAPAVSVHLLYHGIFLFSVLRRTRLLFGMHSYDWIHTMILLSSSNSSFIEL